MRIQKLWKEHFVPGNVRAEPYKIHIYGPGGHFKSHRDTPEKDLVGTFLVGLGDTSSSSAGNFRIAEKTSRAERCSWVAFHPDVIHEVTKLVDGYRAVIAFKMFRVPDDEPELPARLEARVKCILDQIHFRSDSSRRTSTLLVLPASTGLMHCYRRTRVRGTIYKLVCCRSLPSFLARRMTTTSTPDTMRASVGVGCIPSLVLTWIFC